MGLSLKVGEELTKRGKYIKRGDSVQEFENMRKSSSLVSYK